MRAQLLLGVVAGFAMITNVASSQEYVDQECTEVWTCYQIDHFEPIGQEFVPSVSPHTAVELYIDDPNVGLPPDPITVNIREDTIDGPVVATVTTTVPNAEPGWIRFQFPSSVGLTPGQTYVIEASTTTALWGWCASQLDSGCYEPGGNYRFGLPDDQFDFSFKTLVTDEPACGGCPTDANGDGETGPFDLATLLGAWGPVEAGNCLDANGDGDVGQFDLAALLDSWGPCP